MASLSTNQKTAAKTIQFFDRNGKRQPVRLGNVPRKFAESIRLKVEHLVALQLARLPMDAETAVWVGSIGDDLAAKLSRVGLIPERQSQTLAGFLDNYLKRRRAESKPATMANLSQAANDLRGFFGDGATLRDVTEAKADEFRTYYLTRVPKLASATTARRLRVAKMFFAHAKRLKLVDANPFADVSITSILPEENRHYVTAEDAGKLIAAANPTWQAIVALSRFAGLRCPSEVLSLKWEHVNFETGRMTVPSPKTEHYAGRAYRVVPIFPALRPILEEAFDLAAEGEEYVVSGRQGDRYRASSQGPNGWVNTNLRTTFEKIVRRAGLQQWPRLFHNMRASCETDLVQEHPLHVVTAWMGNTPRVAMTHYLQVRESDFEKAVHHSGASGRANNTAEGGAKGGAVVVQNRGQSATAAERQLPPNGMEIATSEGFRRLLAELGVCGREVGLPPAGFEPATYGLGNRRSIP